MSSTLKESIEGAGAERERESTSEGGREGGRERERERTSCFPSSVFVWFGFDFRLNLSLP